MPKKPKLSVLERSILLRERGIERMERHIKDIQKSADEDIASVRKSIKTKRVLLEALKRGEL